MDACYRECNYYLLTLYKLFSVVISEKQGLLLELVQLLSQNEITSRELQLFLQLFHTPTAPVVCYLVVDICAL